MSNWWKRRLKYGWYKITLKLRVHSYSNQLLLRTPGILRSAATATVRAHFPSAQSRRIAASDGMRNSTVWYSAVQRRCVWEGVILVKGRGFWIWDGGRVARASSDKKKKKKTAHEERRSKRRRKGMSVMPQVNGMVVLHVVESLSLAGLTSHKAGRIAAFSLCSDDRKTKERIPACEKRWKVGNDNLEMRATNGNSQTVSMGGQHGARKRVWLNYHHWSNRASKQSTKQLIGGSQKVRAQQSRNESFLILCTPNNRLLSRTAPKIGTLTLMFSFYFIKRPPAHPPFPALTHPTLC